MMRRVLLAAALIVARGAPASAQGLPCPEFPVNEYTTGHQNDAQVASAPNGDFVVVWESDGQDGSYWGIVGRRYDASGSPRGPEFLVNTYTTRSQADPAVALDGSGNFVIVWGSERYFEIGIFGQRYDAFGAPQGGEFRVDTSTAGAEFYPAVAADPAGDFVVVWQGFGQDGDGFGIFGQRFAAAGIPQGAEFQVNTYTTSDQSGPKAAHGPSGDFVVSWVSADASDLGVFGRRFDSSGSAQGAEFQINTFTSFDQHHHSIAGDPNGGYVVVWESFGWDVDDNSSIVGRRLDSSGVPLASDFRINSYTTNGQRWPSVAPGSNGGFVAVWLSFGQDGSDTGIFGSLDCATRLYAVSPCRLADTRNPPGTPLSANSTRDFPIRGICGIPPDAAAVALNVTAVNPSDFGDLRLYPAGTLLPLASSLNFAAGRTRANNAIVPLGTNGQVAVRCDMPPGSSGATHLVLDVFGYFKR